MHSSIEQGSLIGLVAWLACVLYRSALTFDASALALIVSLHWVKAASNLSNLELFSSLHRCLFEDPIAFLFLLISLKPFSSTSIASEPIYTPFEKKPSSISRSSSEVGGYRVEA
ncbi:hypothetical protein VNO77_23594 [Canavalia gladiata]|uniref:Uncharacterized protein n=1 Tax=Canavalia gladiata TaxID=3824 RepID=A0AAN9L610_CANGL